MKRTLKDENAIAPLINIDVKKLLSAVAKSMLSVISSPASSVAGVSALGDVVSAFSLEDDTSKLAWTLVNTAATKAFSNLVQNNLNVIPYPIKIDIVDYIENKEYNEPLVIDKDFFDRTYKSNLVHNLQTFLVDWLVTIRVGEYEAQALKNRFPAYFVAALNEEWASSSDKYTQLLRIFETPFSDQWQADLDWEFYRSWLIQQTEESVFDSPYSLRQLYVPLSAYYETSEQVETDDDFETTRQVTKVVVDLHTHIHEWLNSGDKDDALRIISGGPGSGKSSFAKMLARECAEQGRSVLYVPLDNFDVVSDIETSIARSVVSNFFHNNPVGSSEKTLLVFDGLDEISEQGKVGLEKARDFITRINQLLANQNPLKLRMQVILTGRDIPVQSVQGLSGKTEQLYHLLPYYLTVSDKRSFNSNLIDIDDLLNSDKRQDWWKQYGELTGQGYQGLPENISNGGLDDITAQPLLNYLLSLSLDRGKLRITPETNINEIYDDLLVQVYERGWKDNKDRPGVTPIDKEPFIRVLEEIAVCIWQGSGRTTTFEAVEDRCEKNNLQNVFGIFFNQARDNLTTLFVSFYFREAGYQGTEKTYEFTHKSFGEYLVARRIVRQLVITKEAIELRKTSQFGWSLMEALEQWLYLCAKEPLDQYIQEFVVRELQLSRYSDDEVMQWQDMLCKMITYMLNNGMPMHSMPLPKGTAQPSYKEENELSRNAEEAMLMVLSACARRTERVSQIEWPASTSAGEWLMKLIGYRYMMAHDSRYALILSPFYVNDLRISAPLNWLYLVSQLLINANLYGANLINADLRGADLRGADLSVADLRGADLRGANLSGANLSNADLRGADLFCADLRGANLYGADLRDANLRDADLRDADLRGADLSGANLSVADLSGADLSGADLSVANLIDAVLREANLSNADLYGANLRRANLRGADLSGANLSVADLFGANLSNANLRGANLSNANLRGADLRDADLRGANLLNVRVRQNDLSMTHYDENKWKFVPALNNDGIEYWTIEQLSNSNSAE